MEKVLKIQKVVNTKQTYRYPRGGQSGLHDDTARASHAPLSALQGVRPSAERRSESLLYAGTGNRGASGLVGVEAAPHCDWPASRHRPWSPQRQWQRECTLTTVDSL